MTFRYPDALALSRRVLRALVVLNLIYGAGIVALLVATLVIPDAVFAAMQVKPAPDRWRIELGMRLLAVFGLMGVPLAHVILRRLQAIVDTVRAGDPFLAENASRLQTIAWSLLGIEILHLIIGFIAANSGSSVQPLEIDWSFSFTPWIAVLLLFVLARVFDRGTRMREDLEGTV